MRVNLYESLRSRRVAINVLIHDLNESHKRDWTKSITDFLELFIRCVGTTCELNSEKVSQAINNGSLIDYITAILREIVNYNDQIFIFVDKVTLEQIEKFFGHFFSGKNPMIKDEKWIQFLSACLFALANCPHDHCISVGVYFSLRIVHDLEKFRVMVHDQDFSGSEASAVPQVSIEEEYIKKQISLLLGNVSLGLEISRPCYDRIPEIYCTLVRSSDTLYILENNQLHNLKTMVLIKHKTNKDILLLLEEVLKRGKHEVKLQVVEYLSNCTDTLFGLMTGDSMPIQIASLKLILAAQRLLGPVSFLLPDQNLIVYNKMTSTNNNMRELAKKFFVITYRNPNKLKDEEEQTILQALTKLVSKYEDSMNGLQTIISLLWRSFPPIDSFIYEVCETKNAFSFKILFYYMNKIVDVDVDDVIRRETVNTYLEQITTMASACGNQESIFEIIMDTLAILDLKSYTEANSPTIKIIADLIVAKIGLLTSLPTLYMVNVVLRNIAEGSVYAKEQARTMMRDLSKDFLHDGIKAQQFSAALYIHNVVKLLPQKRWLAVLRGTKEFLEDQHSHSSDTIHHILTIHAELLGAKWTVQNLDYPAQAEEVNEFIELHIEPFITVDKREEDKLFCLQVMQALSVIITNFVVNDELEGHKLWEKMQVKVFSFAQQVIFAINPEVEETVADFHLRKTIMNTVMVILEGIQTAEHRPIHIMFAKFIFLIAKSVVYPEMLQRAVAIVYKNYLNSIPIFGSVCHSFTFYPDDKIMKSFVQLLNQVIIDFEEDETLRSSYRKGVVVQYIENVGRYIRHVKESRPQDDVEEDKDLNRLAILKHIRDLIKHCSEEERSEIVRVQNEFINPDYLNVKEKDALRVFVRSISPSA